MYRLIHKIAFKFCHFASNIDHFRSVQSDLSLKIDDKCQTLLEVPNDFRVYIWMPNTSTQDSTIYRGHWE